VRYLVLNDPHLDIRAPSFRRTDDYMAACFRKLEEITLLCDQHRVDALVCTGDWFHKKNPQAVPHRLVRSLVEWAHTVTDDLRVPLLTVLGNHDVQFNDLSPTSVRKQPVGTLLTNPRVKWLDHEGSVLIKGVTFIGSSFVPPIVLEDGSLQERPEQFATPDGPECIVQLTHASVVPEAPVWEPYTLVSDLGTLSGATICHTGHIHEDLGIHQVTRTDGSVLYWTNVGSMTRGSLTEATIEREPKVLLVEVEPGETPVFTPIVLGHQLAEEIYDVTSYREDKAQAKEFSAWTSRLQEELNAAASQEKSITDLIQESSLDPRGRELALRLLNEAGA
jgi:DNA repair exonuclease SbcCD nuclease subunit